MNFEEELQARLRDSVQDVSADADLADVESRSSRVHRRRRTLMTSSVVALVVVAIGALSLAATRDRAGEPADVPIDTVPVDTVSIDSVPAETVPGSIVESAVPTTAPPVPSTAVPGVTIAPTSVVPPASDRAEPYLDDTEEIYRRVLPNGDVFVARLSEQTFASLFDIAWRAPTGSADECLGERAVLMGVPGTIGDWGSAWVSWGWNDDVDVSTPLEVASMMAAEGRMGDSSSYDAAYALVRTAPDVRQLIVVAPDGAEMDRVDVVEGLGMVRRASSHGDGGPPRLSVVTDDGVVSDPQPFEHIVDAERRPAQCTPGEEPPRPLPPAGEQPADPAAAEAQIRQRYALLVDRSIPFENLPDDLLDDDTGVAAAVGQASTGPLRNTFANATHDIDDVVFTDPTTAWFRYTVHLHDNPTPDHFGVAIFDGSAWRFTRATICGDLQFYRAGCEPAATAIQPPEDPAWVAEHEEWIDQMELYPYLYECSALSQCS